MSIVRRVHGRSGTSLIEVLVTLVIFLVGMVSVIRMFPGGFISLRHDENVTLANRLAQSELERLQGRAGNLPSGILPWGWDGAAYNILSKLDPEDLGDQPRPETGVWPPPTLSLYYATDVNKFRRVLGESTKIPVPAGAAWTGGSVYVLGFSPIMWTEGDPIKVCGGAMRRRWIGNTYTPAMLEARLRTNADYAIDYDDAKLYLWPFPGTAARMYLLSYSYWQLVVGAETPVMLKSASVSITVPAPTDVEKAQGFIEINIPAPDLPDGSPGGLLTAVSGFEGIDNTSDSLAREFDQIAPTAPWSANDPYQYKVWDYVAGVLVFNPIGYGKEEYTARGKEPLTANIDYTVLDWHIIKEERRIPDFIDSPADLDAKLTLRFIKQTRESQEFGGTTYAGLAPTPTYGLTYDVMAVDIDTGLWYTNDPSSLVPGTTDRPAMQVNYKEGIIRFDPGYWAEYLANGTSTQCPFRGKTFRIYYRCDGDWAVYTYKAYDVFRRSYGIPLDYRQYYFHSGNLYFARCNAGSSVAVDCAYRVGASTQDIFASGQVFQISQDTDPGQGLCYVDLVGKLQEVHGSGAVINITRISKVYGVSIGVRVAWREAGRGFQQGRWRKVDLQTYLTRSSN